MKFLSFFFLSALCLSSAHAQWTGTNKAIQEKEQLDKDIQSNRQEVKNAGAGPNMNITPARADVGKWGIDSDLNFAITNHLLGYSTIVEKDQTLQGVKFTGALNVAYYKAKDDARGRSKGRFVFGFEFPIYEFTNGFTPFAGLGLTMGDRKGLYLDGGVDYKIFDWFKLQAGLNYNTDYGIAPQLSAGFVW